MTDLESVSVSVVVNRFFSVSVSVGILIFACSTYNIAMLLGNSCYLLVSKSLYV